MTDNENILQLQAKLKELDELLADLSMRRHPLCKQEDSIIAAHNTKLEALYAERGRQTQSCYDQFEGGVRDPQAFKECLRKAEEAYSKAHSDWQMEFDRDVGYVAGQIRSLQQRTHEEAQAIRTKLEEMSQQAWGEYLNQPAQSQPPGETWQETSASGSPSQTLPEGVIQAFLQQINELPLVTVQELSKNMEVYPSEVQDAIRARLAGEGPA